MWVFSCSMYELALAMTVTSLTSAVSESMECEMALRSSSSSASALSSLLSSTGLSDIALVCCFQTPNSKRSIPQARAYRFGMSLRLHRGCAQALILQIRNVRTCRSADSSNALPRTMALLCRDRLFKTLGFMKYGTDNHTRREKCLHIYFKFVKR